jgi:hypothetical protein
VDFILRLSAFQGAAQRISRTSNAEVYPANAAQPFAPFAVKKVQAARSAKGLRNTRSSASRFLEIRNFRVHLPLVTLKIEKYESNDRCYGQQGKVYYGAAA